MSISPTTKDDDDYTEYEASIIRGHFAVLDASHAELLRQLSAMNAISAELTAAQRGTAWLVEHARPAGAPDALYKAACVAHNSQRLLLKEIAEYTQQLLERIATDRMKIYARLAKVPLPTGLPCTPLQRCDERCTLGASLKSVGVLAGQRCCGALVCSACLYRYNFNHSAQAHLLHAPCFQCGKQRAIFAHFDPPAE